jgi:hypothetical protein
MTRERIFRSTRIAHGLELYSYPPQAITSLRSRRWAGCIIAMSVELREVGESAPWCLSLPPNRAKLNFEQGQVSQMGPPYAFDFSRDTPHSISKGSLKSRRQPV